ncbi:MAG TPA: S4 domain-containing protein [Albitalea sp.]|uniref:RNA-binding S4 domain-containing protein n=1 Tax=Piscinibacter sp. TaxID=1903157 RepID=UPI002ED01C32
MDEVRLDKWLWAARFYKTRSLAVEEIAKGRVQVNGQAAKPARAVRLADRVALRREGVERTVVVRGLSEVRGPAPVAQQLYEETPESIAEREKQAQQRRFGAEPSQSIEQGRPTKRDRRKLADWNRWSASADTE